MEEIAFTGTQPGKRLNEFLFASEEPTIDIGIAGIMAAKPNEPPMRALRKWIEALRAGDSERRSRRYQSGSERCGT
jgi:FlaA1/EpsC-like NDP-sugar epimerase